MQVKIVREWGDVCKITSWLYVHLNHENLLKFKTTKQKNDITTFNNWNKKGTPPLSLWTWIKYSWQCTECCVFEWEYDRTHLYCRSVRFAILISHLAECSNRYSKMYICLAKMDKAACTLHIFLCKYLGNNQMQ